MRATLWKSARKAQYNRKVQSEIAKNPYEAQLWLRAVATLRHGLDFLPRMNIVFHRVGSTCALETSHSRHIKF